MVLNYLYNITESLKKYNNKWYAKPFIWHKKRQLKKLFTLNNIAKISLTKDFLLDLMQFSDLTGIFDIKDNERLAIIKISDKLEITIHHRNNIIIVRYEDLTDSLTIITKEYKDIISINNTQFKDANAIKLEQVIRQNIYEKLNQYISINVEREEI